MTEYIGLPEYGRRVTQMGCGCVKTVVDNGPFIATYIDEKPGCIKHDDRARRAVAAAKKNRSPIPTRLRFDVLTRDEFRCRYCGARPPDVVLEVDHIIPASRGGPTETSNLVTACFDCNRGKRDRILS